jgi:hypothetical protein
MHLGKPTHDLPFLDAAALGDAQFPLAETADQRRVLRHDAEFAIDHGQHDEVGLLVEDGLLGAYFFFLRFGDEDSFLERRR